VFEAASGGGGTAGIVSPGTFTWTNVDGNGAGSGNVVVSTLTVNNNGALVLKNGDNTESMTMSFNNGTMTFTPDDPFTSYYLFGAASALQRLTIGDTSTGFGKAFGATRVFGYDQVVYELGGFSGGGLTMFQSYTGLIINNGGGNGNAARGILDIVGDNPFTPAEAYSLYIASAATGNYQVAVTTTGVLMTGGDTPSLNSCGAGAAIDGNVNAFTVTVGAAVTSCGVIFPKVYPRRPSCVWSEGTQSVTNGLTYVTTTSSITYTQTGLAGNIIDVHCVGK